MITRNGQMELMGIAIVVILLSLGMLFVVKFVILREPSTQQIEYQHSELAANFLNTLLETNAPECSGVKFSTLFADCALHYDIGNIRCGLVESCDYIAANLIYLFNATFDEWRVDYTFIAHTNLEEPISSMFNRMSVGDECPGDRKVKIQPLPLESGDNLFLSLYICG